jgi:hypothetical protein
MTMMTTIACVSHCCHAEVKWHRIDRIFVCSHCKQATTMIFQPPYRGTPA